MWKRRHGNRNEMEDEARMKEGVSQSHLQEPASYTTCLETSASQRMNEREKERAVTSASRDYLTQSAVYVQIRLNVIVFTRNQITRKQTVKLLPLVSQTRFKTSPRLKCKSDLFQLKETCTDWP